MPAAIYIKPGRRKRATRHRNGFDGQQQLLLAFERRSVWRMLVIVAGPISCDVLTTHTLRDLSCRRKLPMVIRLRHGDKIARDLKDFGEYPGGHNGRHFATRLKDDFFTTSDICVMWKTTPEHRKSSDRGRRPPITIWYRDCSQASYGTGPATGAV